MSQRMAQAFRICTDFRLRNFPWSLHAVTPCLKGVLCERPSMRGRRGITAADVVRACVSLRRQRRRIGPKNVRLELETGSYGTIVRYLRLLAFRDYQDRRS